MSNGYDGSIRIKYDVDTRDANSKVMKAANDAKKIEDELIRVKSRMAELGAQKLPTEEYKKLQDELAKAEKAADTLYGRLRVMEKSGDTTSKGYEKLTNQIQLANDKITALRGSMEAMQTAETAYTPGIMSEEYQKSAQRVEELNGKLEVSKKRLTEMCEKQEDFSQETKKSGSFLKTLASRLKGIALSLLIFNWITKAFNAMVSSMKEGFQNLAQYSDEYNQSMSNLKSSSAELKNNLAAAFEPIVNMAIPYLIKLIGWINKAAETISQFFAVMQGKDTYTRAKKQVIDYAKTLDKASQSAKKSLASFDELNVLSNQNSGSSNAGGELTGADAFEQVALTEEMRKNAEKIKKTLMDILPFVIAIGVAFAVWKIAGIVKDLLDMKGILRDVIGVLLAIAGFAIMIKADFDMWENGVDWEGITQHLAGVALAALGLYMLFGPIGAGIAFLVGGIAGLVVSLHDMMENGISTENVVLALISCVGILAGVFITLGATAGIVVAAVMAVIGVIAAVIVMAGNGEEALANLKTQFSLLGTFIKSVFVGDWKTAFKSIGEFSVRATNNGIIVLESFINLFVKALNAIIEGINSLEFTAPDWVPVIGGETLSPNIQKRDEVHLKRLEIPQLANGAVIRGGNPFLAYLGDQPAGQTNIETPLSTMVEAFDIAMKKNNMNQGGSYTFVAQLDSKEIYRQTVRQDQMHRKSTGKSAFAY